MSLQELQNGLNAEIQGVKHGDFPLEVFPQKMQSLILTLASQDDFVVEFTASAMLVAAATAVGNARRLRVRGQWSVADNGGFCCAEKRQIAVFFVNLRLIAQKANQSIHKPIIMLSFVKYTKYTLIAVGVLVPLQMLSANPCDDILSVCQLSENKDTLLKYNGHLTALDLSKCEGLANIKVIGKEAFANNAELTEIILPYTVREIDNGAFVGCKGLVKVVMPESVERIGASAFWECQKLQLSKLPKHLKSIEENAFVRCGNISVSEIPAEVTHVGIRAFAYCSNISTMKITASIDTLPDIVFFNCTNLRTVQLPESISRIGNNAFYGCEQLQELQLPKGECELVGNPFKGCTGVKKVYISSKTFATPLRSLMGTDSVDLNSETFVKY